MFELGADEQAVHRGGERVKGEGVVDAVEHPGAFVAGLETVEVMPEFVGAEALLVDEVAALLGLDDLRYPGRPDFWQDLDAVNDDLAGKHRLVVSTLGVEREFGRGH